MVDAAKADKEREEAVEPSKLACSMIMWKLKFGVALVSGVLFGLIPVRGIIGIFAFLAMQWAAGQLFVKTHNLPDYIFDDFSTFMEHLLTSLSCFVVSWVFTYSMCNF